jgi:hypothetical protein
MPLLRGKCWKKYIGLRVNRPGKGRLKEDSDLRTSSSNRLDLSMSLQIWSSVNHFKRCDLADANCREVIRVDIHK